ncbi:MAG: CDP-glucose 4,6-dehydratase [Treponema sp.]|nr:CDP-glucose 4,6-dehydratase [Treponema sp.]
MAFNEIYKGKKVLVTGNTGFKGAWLSSWLLSLGAEVYGYSLDIPTNPALFSVCGLDKKHRTLFADIQDKDTFVSYFKEIKPDFVFHLAAQAIVSTSYQSPFETVGANVMGTAVVLEALRQADWQCTCVLITSDKVYQNVEWLWGYRENDPLGGKDVYSGSKGAAELIIRCYWNSFIKDMANIKLGIGRAGNVIGGGDWAKDRIVVDCVQAFVKGETVGIRCPRSTRPWQHVLEPLSGYLTLGQQLADGRCEDGEPFNFGPNGEKAKTVYELTQDLAEEWGLDKSKASKITGNIPFKEAGLLKVNCDKAQSLLHWHSTLDYAKCIKLLAQWYKAYYDGGSDMAALTDQQIAFYTAEAASQDLDWAK